MALIVLSLVTELEIYKLGILTSKFYLAMALKDRTVFLRLLTISTFLIVLTSITKAFQAYASSLFSLTVRHSLTQFLTRTLCIQESVFNLSNSPHIDNIDQRATQDVDQLTKDLRVLALSLCIDPILIVYYTWKCVQISGLVGPVLIYAYFIVSGATCKIMSSQLVKLNIQKEKQEGDLRTAHFEFNASSISSPGLHANLDSTLEALIDTSAKLITRESMLKFITESTALFGSLITYIIISILVFSQDNALTGPELAAFVSKSAFVCMYLIYKFGFVL